MSALSTRLSRGGPRPLPQPPRPRNPLECQRCSLCSIRAVPTFLPPRFPILNLLHLTRTAMQQGLKRCGTLRCKHPKTSGKADWSWHICYQLKPWKCLKFNASMYPSPPYRENDYLPRPLSSVECSTAACPHCLSLPLSQSPSHFGGDENCAYSS